MPSAVYRKKTGEIIRVSFNKKALEKQVVDRRMYDVVEFDGALPKNIKDYTIVNGRFKERGKDELHLRQKVILQRRIFELQKDFKEAKKQKLDDVAQHIADEITAYQKQIAQLGAE